MIEDDGLEVAGGKTLTMGGALDVSGTLEIASGGGRLDIATLIVHGSMDVGAGALNVDTATGGTANITTEQ